MSYDHIYLQLLPPNFSMYIICNPAFHTVFLKLYYIFSLVGHCMLIGSTDNAI